ncbi:MAG: NUDIX domain-containing protein [Halobacteriota archaeon]
MRDIVTAFVRHRGDVLFVRRPADSARTSGHWTVLSAPIDASRRPLAVARRTIAASTGVDSSGFELAYAGESIEVTDGHRAERRYPFLFDSSTRSIASVDGVDATAWCPPTDIFDRNTIPALWETYERVAPSVESIASDDEHGSAYLSIRALEVLRDRAAIAEDWADLASVGRDLASVRPSMAVIQNRVNRVLNGADRRPSLAHSRAIEAIDDAARADVDAARNAAELLDGPVITISRSGTVLDAIVRAGVATTVCESRPACEGVTAAERLARAGIDVTLTSDAAIGYHLANGGVSAALVGADTILPNGAVVNKVGTRSLALAAATAEIPRYVVAARDKIATEPVFHGEEGADRELYDGDAPIEVSNPIFDLTPAELVTGVITEAGTLSSHDVEVIAAQHRSNASWE